MRLTSCLESHLARAPLSGSPLLAARRNGSEITPARSQNSERNFCVRAKKDRHGMRHQRASKGPKLRPRFQGRGEASVVRGRPEKLFPSRLRFFLCCRDAAGANSRALWQCRSLVVGSQRRERYAMPSEFLFFPSCAGEFVQGGGFLRPGFVPCVAL